MLQHSILKTGWRSHCDLFPGEREIMAKGVKLDDNKWHTFRLVRVGRSFAITIDNASKPQGIRDTVRVVRSTIKTKMLTSQQVLKNNIKRKPVWRFVFISQWCIDSKGLHESKLFILLSGQKSVTMIYSNFLNKLLRWRSD